MPKIVNTTIQYSTVFEKDHLKIRGGGAKTKNILKAPWDFVYSLQEVPLTLDKVTT